MIQRPSDLGKFEFVILSTLRAAQLMRGCRPRVDGVHKATVIAQLEVATGKVAPMSTPPETNGDTTIGEPVSEETLSPVATL